MCPNLEKIVRSIIVMIQRECAQLILLISDEASRSQHDQSSGSNLSAVYMLVGSISSLIGNFSHLEGVLDSADGYCCVYLLMENQDLAPRLHCCFS